MDDASDREWEAYHDEECHQWQVVNGAEVLATGIETPTAALKMAAAQKMLTALKAIQAVSQGTCERFWAGDSLRITNIAIGAIMEAEVSDG
jgi:hypothetical protein